MRTAQLMQVCGDLGVMLRAKSSYHSELCNADLPNCTSETKSVLSLNLKQQCHLLKRAQFIGLSI